MLEEDKPQDNVLIFRRVQVAPKFVRRRPEGGLKPQAGPGGCVLRLLHPCRGSPTPAAIGKRFFLALPYD
jgi:hypothetical protein